MLKIILNLTLLIIIGTAIYTATHYSDHQSSPQHATNIKSTNSWAINFSYFPTGSKSKQQLTTHKGKIILLHFWATWCPPCIIELPELIKLARNMPNNLIILAITRNNTEEEITNFLQRTEIEIPDNFIPVRDETTHTPNNQQASTAYNVHKLPETVLISAEMAVIEKAIGPQTYWGSMGYAQKLKRHTYKTKYE